MGFGDGAMASQTETFRSVRVWVAVVLIGILAAPIAARAQLAEGEHFQLYLADRYTYEDNLYRLSDSESIAALPNGNTKRDDYINRVSIGLEGTWQLSEQTFHVVARADDSQYQNNSDLDNTSGNARGDWGWRIGSNLSGQLGADYARFQAGFENNQFLQKDVVETLGTFWNAMLRAGPHWRLKTSARHSEIEHGAEVRKFDDTSIDSGGFGVHYETSRGDDYGWDYRYSKSNSNQGALLDGQQFDRSYEENTATFGLRYALTTKTAVIANAGYVHRDYAEAATSEIPRGTFSGSIWDATLQWRPTAKTAINFSGWRKLRAYLDAETDYFVSKGGSIEPSWNPTEKISLRMEYSLEDQDYLGPSVNIGLLGERHDRVKTGQLSLTYSPVRMLQLSLSGRIENRDSDRSELQYDARSANAGIKFAF